jgi:DNA-binding NarL/FixJ family response regulator
MKRITVLLADDHTIVREGFRKMLEMEADFEIVGEAPDGREAVALAAKLCPGSTGWKRPGRSSKRPP